MNSQFSYRPFTDADEQSFLQIPSQCFGGSLEYTENYLKRIGKENVFFLCQGEQVVGSVAIYHMGQWYGGRSVPMAGIAAVGVAPEYRGTGAAYTLMSQTLLELYASGTPISALYPATQVLYRKVGYEQGGIMCFFQIPAKDIILRDRNLPMQRVETLKPEIFQTLYSQQASLNNGNLDRNQAIWERVIEPPETGAIYGYLVGKPGKPQGYIIFSQARESNGFELRIRDWVLPNAEVARRVWTFLGDHRSLIDNIHWRGATINSRMLLLPEQSATIEKRDCWMLRIINLPVALSKRGYPPNVETKLHLEVTDDLIAPNNGKFCLQISQGWGEVTEGGKAELKLDIRALAALYTGLFTPYQLQQAGYLEGSVAALATAAQLFAGSEPWMSDFF